MNLLGVAVLFLFLLLVCLWVGHSLQESRNQQAWKRQFELLLGEKPDPMMCRRWKRNPDLERFADQIHLAKQRVQQQRVLFVGLSQEGGRETTAHWIPLLRQMGAATKDYRILVMENDSIDDTRTLWLQEAKQDPHLHILCRTEDKVNLPNCHLEFRAMPRGGDKEANIQDRVERMASLRQIYLDFIDRYYADYDILMVIDWDLIGKLSLIGWFHALSILQNQTQSVDVVTVNSLVQDRSFLFGKKDWRIFDTFPMIDHRYRCHSIQDPKRKKQMDQDLQKAWSPRLREEAVQPIPVFSAFGGMALYRLSSIQKYGATYQLDVSQRQCPLQCEHTNLHQKLRVVIDPLFIFLIQRNLH